MARTVKVGEFQNMQRAGKGPNHTALGESDALGDREPNGSDVATVDQLTGQVVDAEPIEPKPDDRAELTDPWPHGTPVTVTIGEREISGKYLTIRDHGDGPLLGVHLPSVNLNWGIGEAGLRWLAPDQVRVDPEPTMADELISLNVEASCTAEMSLSMVVGKVKDAVFDAHVDATDDEIRAEAERIWTGFGDQRKGPRVATVAGDGTVRDWRRPDNTPDRGPDVGTIVHQVTDQETRFSGAGATDKPTMSDHIPSDHQFSGKLYREAPELANLAEELIGKHGFLEALEHCDIRWYWKRKTGVSKGRVKIGFMKRASDLLGHFTGADFIGWLSATTARNAGFSDQQVEAAVFHQLLHIGSDDKGNWIFVPHDFEGFAQEVRVYGTWTEGLKLGGQSFVAAHQMGLFDASDEEEEDDEDDEEAEDADVASGAAYYVDGQAVDDQRPYAQEEPPEFEERRPGDPFMADQPADPDRPYDDEEPDTTGELPTDAEIDEAMTDRDLV